MDKIPPAKKRKANPDEGLTHLERLLRDEQAKYNAIAGIYNASMNTLVAEFSASREPTMCIRRGSKGVKIEVEKTHVAAQEAAVDDFFDGLVARGYDVTRREETVGDDYTTDYHVIMIFNKNKDDDDIDGTRMPDWQNGGCQPPDQGLGKRRARE